MSGMKVRHDFASGEEIISGSQRHHSNLSASRDDSQTLHKTNMAALGTDVAGSEGAATIGKIQFERDTLSIDSAQQLQSGNQRSQDIQQSAAQQATQFFSNRA